MLEEDLSKTASHIEELKDGIKSLYESLQLHKAKTQWMQGTCSVCTTN